MPEQDFFCELLRQLADEHGRKLAELSAERDALLSKLGKTRHGRNGQIQRKACAFVKPCPIRKDQPTQAPPMPKNHVEHKLVKADSNGLVVVAAEGPPARTYSAQTDETPHPDAGLSRPQLSSPSSFDQMLKTLSRRGARSNSGLDIEHLRTKFGLKRTTLWNRIVDRDEFDIFVGILVIFSTALLGLRTHADARGKTDEAMMFDILERCCNVLFTAELLLRILARGRDFYNRVHRFWSFLDTFLVLLSWTDLFASSLVETTNVYAARIVRMLRLARVMRIIKVIRALAEVKTIMYQIAGSFVCFFWVLLILVGLIFTFALPLTNGATYWFAQDAGNDANKDRALVKEYFGDVLKTMYTLFMSITNGVSWKEPARCLQMVGAHYFLMFLAYICLAVFSILNVVTGVFVDCAMQCAENDRSMKANRAKRHAKTVKSALEGLMESMDADRDGSVSIDEWLVMAEVPHIQAMLHELEICALDLEDAFVLLDIDGDGRLHIDEFIDGLTLIKGNARSIAVYSVLRQVQNLKYSLDELRQDFRRRLPDQGGDSEVRPRRYRAVGSDYATLRPHDNNFF